MAVPEILSLAAQQVWTRHEIKKGTETRAVRSKRRKESDVWAEVVEAIGPAAPDQCWVSVSDRASDIFSFVRRARAQGWHCLWRVGQNRVVLAGSGRKAKLLLDWVRRLPAQTETVVELRGRAEQASRTVRLQVAWSEVTLCPPCNGQERQQAPVSGWCVRCWETSKRKQALEWILFTTLPVIDAASAWERIEWYWLRWVVEEYHKALKTGCALEQRQGQSAPPGRRALRGLLALVAVRLLAASHSRPHRPGYAGERCRGTRALGNRGPAPRRRGGPEDRRPVRARSSGPGRLSRTQRRGRSRLADPLAWLATFTRLVLECACRARSRPSMWVRTRPARRGLQPSQAQTVRLGNALLRNKSSTLLPKRGWE
jgi:hypothetical protein